MKRIAALIISVMISAVFMLSLPVTAAENNAPSRVINLVYDDSGSMIELQGAEVDTWCQAKYAMEVFAAMLGEKDTMNIYVMSDFDKSDSAPPHLVLKGSDDASANVSKVHDMITTARSTPFDSVRKAYSDLTAASADEKWLVVLTDGAFGGIDDMDAYFAQKQADINVMFLSMGVAADGITPDEANNIYYAQAKQNSEILSNITDISTRIFNSDRLEVDVSSKNFSFDVPMGELVVFAQGANVEISGIKNSGGTLIKSSSTPVSVKYSEKAALNYENFIIDRDLNGCIATFRDDFAAGSYTVDVSGAETIEIYYKPNIEIAAYLINAAGDEVTDLTDLEAGEYTIEFGFVKSGTSERVPQSDLLGDVSYSAYVTNNDVTHDKTYSSGDKITLEEGSLSISVTARYLEYNTVSTELDYSIFRNKALDFEIISNPEYSLTGDGFAADEPISVKAYLEGSELTDEQWELMAVPEVKLSSEEDFEMGKFTVEKTDETGIYHIYPSMPASGPDSDIYGNCEAALTYSALSGSETWSGSADIPVSINDSRSWIERNCKKFVKLVIFGAILFILIGYLPFIKHYLPKSLKRKPHIKCKPEELGMKRREANGLMEKSFASTILPYVSQTAKIKYVPKGVTGAPPLEVKAIKRRRMAITNIKAFYKKPHIILDGTTIKEDIKRYETSAGLQIVVKKTGWTYTCTLNQ